MEVNEANQKLRVTDEEVKALQDYFGFLHTSINLLADLEPRAYFEQKNRQWVLAENKEEFQKSISTFVNLYSLIYKDSLGSKGRRDLVRGTSGAQARRLTRETRQFLSTSRDESVAKKFCKAGESALVRVSIGEGVPHLYSDNYINLTANENEQEVIISPFCKIKDNRLMSRWNGYEYYSVSIEKGELQEKSAEEIESLTTQVVEGYEQNVADMKEYVRLADRQEYLQEKLRTAVDPGDRSYFSEELKKVKDEFYAVWKRTTQYKENLNGLLQGMCREKEKEIDQAKEIVDKDREERRKQREAKKKEEERKGAIAQTLQKIGSAIGSAVKINGSILTTYRQLIDKEKTARQRANDFGFGFDSSVETELQRDITFVTKLVDEVAEKLKGVQIPEDSSIEQVQKQLGQNTNLIDKINASRGISDALSEVVELFEVQADDTIKKDLYFTVSGLIKSARINKLQQQKEAIKSQKTGLFDRITGKTRLQKLQLKNIDLKIQLARETVPEKKEHYSIRDMLAEIYTFSQTELGGQYTPELERVFNEMQEKFQIQGGRKFTLEYIQKLAGPKIAQYQKQNLPTIQRKRFRLFGRNKDQIENLEEQNSQVQNQINNASARKLRNQLKPPVKSAVAVFKDRLNAITNNLEEKGPQIMQDKTIEGTVDLGIGGGE